jgi:hypothetical protein
MTTTTLPMKILYEKDGDPVAAFVTKRFNPFTVEDPSMRTFLVTANRIHTWVYVTVGPFRFKTVQALQFPPITTPQLPREKCLLFPLRHDDMVFPPDPSSELSLRKLSIISDDENINAKEKFIRLGFWYSSYFAGGPPLGYNGRIYIVPDNARDQVVENIKKTGAAALQQLESFPDATIDPPEYNIVVHEEFEPKKWWQFWK